MVILSLRVFFQAAWAIVKVFFFEESLRVLRKPVGLFFFATFLTSCVLAKLEIPSLILETSPQNYSCNNIPWMQSQSLVFVINSCKQVKICVSRWTNSEVMVLSFSAKSNPQQVNTILNMVPPRELEDVHKLIGCLASVSRLIFRLGERGFPYINSCVPTVDEIWSAVYQEVTRGSRLDWVGGVRET